MTLDDCIFGFGVSTILKLVAFVSINILLKTRKLAQYLVGTRKTIDFSKPAYAVERQDRDEIRKKILSISYSEWKEMGFSKGTLHYMKKNAKADKSFTMNAHVRERLEMWENI